jgi:hypothetical protein
MSEQHLRDLRTQLEAAKWRIDRELPGDDRAISAVWEIARTGHATLFHLEFDGLHESGVLPIDRAYACHIREAPHIQAYFARINRSWGDELASFVEKLDSLHQSL